MTMAALALCGGLAGNGAAGGRDRAGKIARQTQMRATQATPVAFRWHYSPMSVANAGPRIEKH
jgi:hypothetical protein